MFRFEGQMLAPLSGETVLECLERHGHRMASSCRSGVCQSCVLRARSGRVPEEAQAGLKATWRQQGYLLACVCRQTSGLDLVRCGQADVFESRVNRVRQLARRVFGIWLERPPGLKFEAGQFVQLTRASDELTRPYSIASTPDMEELELHVARAPGGKMSGWLPRAVGHTVSLRGPFGDCFYAPQTSRQPLLLAGSSTGLAPLLGVVRAALSAGHRGPLHLYHAARTPSGLYHRAELERLARAASTFQVRFHHLGPHQPALHTRIFEDLPKLAGFGVYLCGSVDFVNCLRKQSFLRGAALQDIFSDAFIHAPRGVRTVAVPTSGVASSRSRSHPASLSKLSQHP